MPAARKNEPVAAAFSLRCGAFVVLCLLAGTLSAARGAARAEDLSIAAFRKDALLRRFDKDQDGTLSERERAALREAFGGLDVPMLPAEPYDYATLRLPAHADRSEFEQSDNTPDDNRLTDAGAELGRVLFYDTQLSLNNTVSCASCHRQRAGFSDPRRFSLGFAGQRTSRASMRLANLRYTNFKGTQPGFFWDERAPTLEAQILMPIQDKIEMGMPLTKLEARLPTLPYYPPLFEAAFGSSRVTSERVAQAIAQFLRSMVSLDSRFDRAAAHVPPGNYSPAFEDFTDEENLGKSLFIDGLDGIPEFGCATCHVPPTFGMPRAFNNGLARHYTDAGLGALDRESNDPFTPSNDGKFKAPSLRNVAPAAPYMHDGRFTTLEEVVEHYSNGIHPHENLGLAAPGRQGGAEGSGYNLSEKQKAALVAFLKTLTDEQFLCDPRFSDPFVRSGANQESDRQ